MTNTKTLKVLNYLDELKEKTGLNLLGLLDLEPQVLDKLIEEIADEEMMDDNLEVDVYIKRDSEHTEIRMTGHGDLSNLILCLSTAISRVIVQEIAEPAREMIVDLIADKMKEEVKDNA